MLSKGRLLVVVAAMSAAMSIGSAAPAQASLLSGLTTTVSNTVGTVTNTTSTVVASTPLAPLAPVVQNLNVVPAGYDPVAPLVALVGGQVGPLTAVDQLLCPPLTKVAELVASLGQPAIAGAITTIACSTGILEYKFVTHFKRADGTLLERTTAATFGVPTLIDVDGDGVPDFIGTLTLTGTNSIGLTVDRMATNTGISPSAIEAVIKDPGGLLLGDRSIRFGFDSTMDRAPQQFVLSTPLNTILAPSATYTAAISQKTPGTKIALVAGTFAGTYQARSNPIDLSLLYGASPTSATISAGIGSHDVIALSQNTVGPATATGHVVNGTDVQDFGVDITNLPNTLSVDIATGNTVSVGYAAAARVATIRGTLTRTKVVGSTTTLLQKAILNLDDVPTGIQLQIGNGNNSGSITTTGGPIGLTKVGLANGEPRFLTDAAYVNVDQDATVSSIAAQIPGLENATFSLTPKITLAATIASTKFRARVAQVGRTIDAMIDKLPHKFSVGFDPAALTLDYDGNGSGINSITVAGDSVTPFFSRATKIRATIGGIPALLHAALGLTSGAGSFDTAGSSGPINSVELVASNGPETLPAGGGQGAIFHDVPNGEYLIAARILGVRRIAFSTTTGAAVSAITQGGPFSLDVLTGTLKATGLIQDLPAQTTIDYNTQTNHILFVGKQADGTTPQGINTLTLDAQTVGGGTLFGRADHVNLVVNGIPASEDLALITSGNQVGVTASDAISKIELVAANRVINRTADLPAGTDMGVRYVDTTATFLASARVLGFKKLILGTGNPLSVDAETAGGPFHANVQTNTLTASADILNLPAKTTLTADLTGGHVTFTGRDASNNPAPVNSLDVSAVSTTALFGRATNVKAHIGSIPSDLTLDFTQAGGGISITANNAIGLIEVGAANRAVDLVGDLPAGGNQGVNYTDLTGGTYAIGARVKQFKKAAVTTGDPITLSTITQGGPFYLNATTNAFTAHAAVLDLPAQLDASLSLSQGKLTVDGHGQPISQITADANSSSPLFGRADHVKLNIQGIPDPLVVDFAQNGGGVSIEANSPISLIEVGAANRAVDLVGDLPTGGNQGVNFTDLTGGTYAIGARVKQFKKAAITIGDPITLSTITQGGPFYVNANTNAFTAHAAVLDLPAALDASLSLTNGHLTVDGHGQGIGQITADANSSSPLFGRADHFKLNIQGIPALLNVDFAQSGGGVSISADNAISLIEVGAANRAVDLVGDLPTGGTQGVNYTDLTGGDYVVGARVKDFKKLSATLSDPIHLTAITQGGPFVVNAHTNTLTANAQVLNLPPNLDATLDLGHGKLIIDGHGQGIAQLKATAHSTTALFGRATDVSLNVADIPASLNVDFTQSGGGVNLVADNPIGLIEVIAANRGPVPAVDLPLNNEQGVNFVDLTGGEYLVAARIKQLKQLAFATSPAITVDAQTDGGAFGVHALTDNLSADARVENLPHNLHASLDTANGKLVVNGNGEAIAHLSADVHSTTPLFLGATNIHADILSIPDPLTVDFAEDADGVGLSTNEAIGSIEVAAANHTFNPVTDLPADQGLKFTDHSGGDFLLGARVRQLKKARVSTGTPIKLSLETEGGTFTADVDTDDITAHALIDQLPAKLTASLDLDAGDISITGRHSDDTPAGIDHLLVDASSATALFGRADHVHADIHGIGSDLNLHLSQAGGGVNLTASQAIDSIEVVARNGAIADPNTYLPAPGTQGATFIDKTGGEFLVAARVLQLKSLSAAISDTVHIGAETAGGPFTLHAETDDLTGDAQILDLPRKLDIGLNLDAGQITVDSLDANGDPQRINQIKVNLSSNTTALFSGVHNIAANIEGIPGHFTLDLAQTASGVHLEANDPIDLLEVAAQDAPITDLNAVLPADQGAIFHDADAPGGFKLAARIRKLSLIDVSLDPDISLQAKTEGGPFTIDVDTAGLKSTGHFNDLPADVTLGLDQASGAFSFTGKDANGNPQGVDDLGFNVTSDTPFFAGAKSLSLSILHLAPTVTINLANTGSGGSITTDQPIEQIEILASSDATLPAFPSGSIPNGEQGFVYHDNSPDFLLAARLLDLKSITFGLGGTNIGLTSELRSTPFNVDVDAQGLNATARIDKLPAKTSLGFDLDNGHFTFDGHDASNNPVGIDSIVFGADAPADAPLFGAATKLRGSILTVPSHLDIGFDQADGLVNLTTGGGAIGTLDFLASNDNSAAFRTQQGITFHETTNDNGTPNDTSDDTPDQFLLSAHVLGLQTLVGGIAGLNADPNDPNAPSSAITLNAVTSGGLFDLDILSDTFSATGTIADLPSTANINADLGNGQVTFDGSSGIHDLSLVATAQPDHPIFGRANHLLLHIVDLPAHVTVGISQPSDDPNASTNTGASIEASDPAHPDPNDPAHFLTINTVEIGAWNDTAGNPLSTLTGQGIIYHDIDTDPAADVTTGDFAIGARINSLKKLSADFGDALNLSTVTAGGPFHADITTAGFDETTSDPTGLSGVVDILNLPPTFTLAANLGSDPIDVGTPSTPNVIQPGTISYIASTTIGELSAEIGSATPLISDANNFKIDLKQLPAAAAIGVAPDSGQLTLSAGGGQIGEVDLQARDSGTPAYPGFIGGATDNSAFLDGTGGHFVLAARIFKLQNIGVTLDPVALDATVGDSRPFHADLKLPPSADALAADPNAANTHATLDILNMPTHLNVGIGDIPTTIVDPAHPDPGDPAHFKSGGTQITYSANAAVGELKIAADGVPILAGASTIAADLYGVPQSFTMQLPDTDVLVGANLATLTMAAGTQIDELDLAAGSYHLGLPINSKSVQHTTGNDQFAYDGTTATFGVGVRLTGVKGLSMNLDPVNLSIDQNAATTKIIGLDATLPQDPPLPNSTVTGTLNKPTAHTELGVTLTPGQPTVLHLKNGLASNPISPGNANQTMTSISLALTNLGSIPSATFSLSHIPKQLDACLATNGDCVRTDSAHATTQYSSWNPSGGCTPRPQNPGNFPTTIGGVATTAGHRPYNPQVSMYFDDNGTSVFTDGVNSANNRNIANMITMNANIALSTGPVVITNLRFHQLSMDFAQQPLTNPTSNPPDNTFTFAKFTSLTNTQVPRIYLYLDSQKLPFVMNSVAYPPSIPKMVMGTDGSPARAFKRISWIPGSVRTSSFLGCGLGQNVDTQSQNGLDCGGNKELDIDTGGILGTINAFNIPLFGDVLNICGGTVPTT